MYTSSQIPNLHLSNRERNDSALNKDKESSLKHVNYPMSGNEYTKEENLAKSMLIATPG
jgi:hypothetical protein